LRIGYLVACPSLVKDLERINNPKACSGLTRHMALTALTTSLPAYKRQIDEINSTKAGFISCMRTLIGSGSVLNVMPCKGGNFTLIQVEDCNTAQEKLKDHGLYVRVRHTADSTEGILMVTIGGRIHMRQAFATLSKTLSDPNLNTVVCLYNLASGDASRVKQLCTRLQNHKFLILGIQTSHEHHTTTKALHVLGVKMVSPSKLCQMIPATAQRIVFFDSEISANFENIFSIITAARGSFLVVDDSRCESETSFDQAVYCDENGFRVQKSSEAVFFGKYAGVASLRVEEAQAVVDGNVDGNFLQAFGSVQFRTRVCSTLEKPM